MAMLSVEREITALQQDKQYSGMQKDIFAIVSKVLPPDTSLRPSQATDAIDNLFPKAQSENKTISEKDTEDFLWAFWNVLIDVVQAVHSLHFGHVEIIKLVENLSRKSHGTVTIWGVSHSL